MLNLLLFFFIFKDTTSFFLFKVQDLFFFFYKKPLLSLFVSLLTLFFFFKKKLLGFLFFNDLSLVFPNPVNNPLHNNSFSFIHPTFLIICTLNFFLFFFFFKIKTTCLFLFIFILGCLWSSQEVLWNGLWDWNLLEVSNLLVLLIVLWYNHFIVNKKHKNDLLFLNFLVVFLFNNYLDIKSVHSFFFLPSSVYSKINFLILFFFFFKKKFFFLIFLFNVYYSSLDFFFKQNFFFFNKVLVIFFLIFIRFSFSKVFTPLVFVSNLWHLYFFFFFLKNINHFFLKSITLVYAYINGSFFFFLKRKKIFYKTHREFFLGTKPLTFDSFFFYKQRPRIFMNVF